MKFAGPDTRGWVMIGLFGLTGGIFGLLAVEPDLARNQLFVLLAQAVVVSGLIGAIGFYFGSSKKDGPTNPQP